MKITAIKTFVARFGNRPRALLAYRELCSLEPDHPRYCQEKQRLESAP